MADDDVGRALAGPFDRFLSPYDLMRRSGNVEYREDERWPTASLGKERDLPKTPTNEALLGAIQAIFPDVPPIDTRLQREAGVGDIERPSQEELLKFIIDIDRLNPPPAAPSVPLPGPIPLPRRRP